MGRRGAAWLTHLARGTLRTWLDAEEMKMECKRARREASHAKQN